MEANQFDTETPETFHFLNWYVDVQKAKLLLASKKRPTTGQMNISDVAKLIGEPGKYVLGIGVSWDRVQNDASINLEVPVILAYTPHGELFPIDGWHRIAKAKLQGVEKLPCVVLSRADSKKVCIG
jgi:hypothetical protein